MEFPVKRLDSLEDGVTATTEIVDDHGLKVMFGVPLNQLPNAIALRRTSDEGHGERHASRNPRCPGYPGRSQADDDLRFRKLETNDRLNVRCARLVGEVRAVEVSAIAIAGSPNTTLPDEPVLALPLEVNEI